MKYILLIILCSISVNAGIEITEVMYNPEGSDNNKEYIELYSEEELNLSDYTIEDASNRDTLTLLSSHNDSLYTLIVEDGFNYTLINASIYSVGASIGNNLNNDQDIVILKDRVEELVDTLTYDSSMGGNNNNKSLCRNVENNQLVECTATPGAENIIDTDEENDTDEDTEEDSEIIPITINEFFPNPVGSDDNLLPEGEWVELYNTGDEEIDLAGLHVCDARNSCVTINNHNVIESTVIPSKGYLVVFMNGDSILNNNGFEEVTLYPDSLDIRRVSPKGRETRFQFNPFWTKIEVFKDFEDRVTDIVLKSKERSVKVGAFLNPDDKKSFAFALSSALYRVKR